jgi:hypothetical protein
MRSFICLVLLVATAHAQPKSDPDTAAIRATALDYIEGWYEGNVERMTRAVHPELVKRIVVNEQGTSRIEGMGATKLIAGVRSGFGKNTPKPQKDVTILDRYENVASVKIVASDWIDYLHIAKVDGRWQIVNVLWEKKPEAVKKAEPGKKPEPVKTPVPAKK